MWYAFARDDGMPGSRWLKRISGQYRTPVCAIWVTCFLAILLCIYAAAYYVITSISTITLYLAYIIPVYLNWRNRCKNSGEFVTPEMAPWNLGKKSNIVNTIAIVYTCFIAIVFVLPPNELALWTMVLVAIFLFFYWHLRAKHSFVGPKRSDMAA
jgi:amino acid transporter